MKLFLLTLIGATSSAFALWEQCGGKNWAGTTTCAAGESCYAQNEYYSQCISSTQATAVVDDTPAVTVTAAAAAATTSGVQIRGVSSPVYHLYLQSLSGVPVLGPETSGGRFVISGSIQLLGTTPLYLNIANNSTSYKTLTFDATPSFNGWALEGDTIITAQSSSFGRQLNFLACPSGTSGYYKMYLQTGNDTPGSGCSMQTIHLPCLC